MRDRSPADAAEGPDGSSETARARRRSAARIALTVALLAGLLAAVDPGDVAARLAALDPRWLAAGVVASLPTYLALAARWRLTARRLGLPLGRGRALAEYYLSTWLNQTLPLGVAGDAVRAVRHGRAIDAGPGGPRGGLGRAIRVLLLERAAGLAALALAAAAASVSLHRERPTVAAIGLGGAGLLTLGIGGAAVLRGRRGGGAAIDRLLAEARIALLGAAAAQLALALVALGGLVAMYYCAGRAAALPLDAARVAQLAPLLLAAGTLPLGLAGWGARETAAAALFGALGLDAASGVTLGVTFGLLSLAASAPGLAVALAPVGAAPRHADAGATADADATAGADGDAARDADPARAAAFGFCLAVLACGAVAVLTGDAAWLAIGGAVAIGLAVVAPARPWSDRRARSAANAVTLARLVGVAALPALEPRCPPIGFAAAIGVLLALDVVDGALARRRGTASAAGARLDMETDALLVAVLAILLHQARDLDAWIWIAGTWRYAYGALVALAPGAGEQPRSRLARAIAAVLMLGLAAAFALGTAAAPVAAVATALVSLSFARSLWWSYGRGARANAQSNRTSRPSAK